MFLKKACHAAPWSDEPTSDALHARAITGEPIVFWREEGGHLQAILDRHPVLLATDAASIRERRAYCRLPDAGRGAMAKAG